MVIKDSIKQEVIPNVYDIVVFVKKLEAQHKGDNVWTVCIDHNNNRWNIFDDHADLQIGKAYLFSYQLNDKGFPDILSIRLLQNVFKQNAIKETVNRNEIIKELDVALSYAKDLVIGDKISLDNLFVFANKIHDFIQHKADEAMGLK